MPETSGGGRLAETANKVAAGWLVSLPILAAGMACFWLKRDAAEFMGLLLGIGALAFVGIALVAPGLLCARGAGRRELRSLPLTVLKALIVAVVSLVAASLLSAVEALRPESVSFFAQEFAGAHAIAAALPGLLAVGWIAFTGWRGGSSGWLVRAGIALAVGAVGVALWWWSAGVAYAAMRYSNAHAILLMTQTVALAALLMASVADAVLCKSAPAGAQSV